MLFRVKSFAISAIGAVISTVIGITMLVSAQPGMAQSSGNSGLSFDSIVSGRNLPIDVSADALEVIQSDSKASFTGNVEVTQGVMKLTAQQVSLYYNENAKDDEQPIDQVEANGNIVMTTENEKVTADRLVYKINEAKIYLIGNVVLSRDDNTLGGETLVIDLITGYSRIEGGPENGGRVRARFTPGSIGD